MSIPLKPNLFFAMNFRPVVVVFEFVLLVVLVVFVKQPVYQQPPLLVPVVLLQQFFGQLSLKAEVLVLLFVQVSLVSLLMNLKQL